MTTFTKSTAALTAITAVGAASRKEESAVASRDTAIVKAADAMHAAGVTAKDIAKGGAQHDAAYAAFAQGRLTPKEYAVFADPSKKRKVNGKYTPKHALVDRVTKAYARFTRDVGKALDAMSKGATAKDVAKATKDAKAATASKNARGRAKPLAEALETGLADLIRRTNTDKAKDAPSGKAHAETAAILRKAAKEIAALQK